MCSLKNSSRRGLSTVCVPNVEVFGGDFLLGRLWYLDLRTATTAVLIVFAEMAHPFYQAISYI